MKKTIFTLIITLSIQLIYAQGMLRKSKSYVVSFIHKDKTIQYDGNGQMNDMGFFVIHYDKVYRVKGFYPYQATYYYWFDPEKNNLCMRYFVIIPNVYLRNFMAQLKGYLQIDGTNFRSLDGQSTLSIDRSNDPCTLLFLQKDFPMKASSHIENLPQPMNLVPTINRENPILTKNEDKNFNDNIVSSLNKNNLIGQSFTWICHDTRILNLLSIDDHIKFKCKILHNDTVVNSTVKSQYMLVSLKPILESDCGCIIYKFITYQKNQGIWKLTNQIYTDNYYGNFGDTSLVDVKKMGESKAFIFSSFEFGQGIEEGNIGIYGYVNGSVKKVFNIDDAYLDNEGACDKTKTNSCYKYDSKVKFVPSNKGYYDLSIEKIGTIKKADEVVNIDQITLYQLFNDTYQNRTL
jgi:hypothetical protein